MIKKESFIDRMEITKSGRIQVRRKNLIIEDGKEIASTFHRHVLSPGDSLEGQDARVKALSKVVWTPSVVKAFKERKKEVNQ